MKICTTNTAVEFDPSEKKMFKENLYRGGGVLALGFPLLILMQSVSLNPWLLRYNHITPSAQLIWIIISTLRPSKGYQTGIDQQLDPSPNATKENNILMIPENYEMVQHISPINKSVLQDIFAPDFKYAHNKAVVLYSSQEAF